MLSCDTYIMYPSIWSFNDSDYKLFIRSSYHLVVRFSFGVVLSVLNLVQIGSDLDMPLINVSPDLVF